jgi:hypothetical protein
MSLFLSRQARIFKGQRIGIHNSVVIWATLEGRILAIATLTSGEMHEIGCVIDYTALHTAFYDEVQ